MSDKNVLDQLRQYDARSGEVLRLQRCLPAAFHNFATALIALCTKCVAKTSTAIVHGSPGREVSLCSFLRTDPTTECPVTGMI